MRDRGSIKWAPFNSVINSEILTKEILKEKSKINKPILSDEQLDILEHKINDNFHNQVKLNFIYYKNGELLELSGYIKKIDNVNQKIILDSNKCLYFCEIIKIKEIDYSSI